MPELPEVEFAGRRLRGWLVGRLIASVEATAGSPLRDLTPAALASGLIGRRVVAVRRHGKQLFLDLDDGHVWLCHLGMTGKFVRRAPGEAERAGTRARLGFADGGPAIDFVDPRRFGRLRLLGAAAAAAHPEVARLGPDALDLAAAPTDFAARVGRGRAPIKVALLDQRRLAGVGNIYACEALHDAGVNPWTPAGDLTGPRLEALARAVEATMRASLARETDDEITYLQQAKATNPFRVYGRAGEDCPCCGERVSRAEQAGRGTFWTPTTQP